MSSNRFARVFLVGTWLGAIAAAALAAVGAPLPMVFNAALIAHITGLLAGYIVAVMAS